jgi:predicted transcriptional regulator
METTSIQISKDLLKELKSHKMYDKESYEEIIWDLLEDRMELSEETESLIEESEREIQEGKGLSLEEVKRELDL